MNAPILSLRAVATLCIFALLLAALNAVFLCYGSGWLDVNLLPGFLTTIALFFSALGAPFLFADSESRRGPGVTFAARSGLAALWCGVATCFMLLVSTRVTPIEISGVIHASIWITALAWISMLLNSALPRSASALLFVWIVILPVGAYMLAEVFLTSPAGGSGLAESSAPQASALRSTIHWLLNLSPGTATFGALNGKLADGSDCSHTTGYLTMFVAALLSLSFAVFQRTTADSRAVPSSASQS